MAPPARQRVADLRSRSSWGTLWCPRSRPPPRSLGRRQSRIRSGSASLRHSSAAVRAAGERAATARHPPLPSWSIILNSVSISVALLQSFSFDSSLYTCDGRGSAGISRVGWWGVRGSDVGFAELVLLLIDAAGAGVLELLDQRRVLLRRQVGPRLLPVRHRDRTLSAVPVSAQG